MACTVIGCCVDDEPVCAFDECGLLLLLLDEDNDDFLLFDFDDDGDEDMDFVVVDAGVLGFIIFCKLKIHTRHSRTFHSFNINPKE